ncbi:Stk1 family PASTA domain-containing Ser/Thr kinase [Virgibacillus sp. W0181]|uniref:Stk1 family PASTA domain-containing Ser/Thr kinase n=1 Tax=Virgibacillus sp. W0181 TaxID=3391581 RepID=UPI003F458086
MSERYRIKAKIGGGGMANVYLARDIILDRDVAIKALRLEYANDEEFIQRFDREAQAATSLSHPNIVNIYDVGEEDHILYMVMEYVDGLTLKEYIQRFGAIDVEEAIDIMKQITAAIAHAHANDLVHRDIKPQNILMDSFGNVKVTDFGIAVALSATSLTQTNAILGSVHYLSPEQARGGIATKKSDIYSLGIVLFELLTGRLPFSGQSPISIALKHLQNDTPSVRQVNPNIPQSIENIVLKATTKDPFHRFNNVYEMENALVTALDPIRMNEEVFTPPVEEGEETKAIPIITNQSLQTDEQQDTIIQQNDDTKKVPDANKTNNKPKKKKRKRKKWLIMLAALLVLLIVAISILIMTTPKDVTIPDVVEMEYEEAVAELSKLKLKTEQESIFSEELEEGLVVKSNPQAGRTVKEGATVTLFVSEGEETVTFEDYTGQDFKQVERMLSDEGFEVIDYDKYSDEPIGTIISQIEPVAGKEVVPRDTKAIFEVSAGPELIQLNNLKGLSESEAKDYLTSHGLKMTKHEENSEDVPKGQVIRHSPDANAQLKEGTSVDVYISSGPEKKPPVSHTVSFTVPYDGQTDEESGTEKVPQTVIIYIGDMNNQVTEVYKEDEITNDKDYSITLTIEQNKKAEYKVIRDDEVFLHDTVSYEEGE